MTTRVILPTKIRRAFISFPEYFQLSIDHVQGDPFASPSKLSIHIKGAAAGFPKKELFETEHRRIALQDYLTRQFGRGVEKYAFKAKGSGKSGLISVSRCGQEILERTACSIDVRSGDLVLRLEAGFPANGRTINARELMKILFDFLPECVENSLYYKKSDKKRIEQTAFLADRPTVPSGSSCPFWDWLLLWRTELFCPQRIRNFFPANERGGCLCFPGGTESDAGTSSQRKNNGNGTSQRNHTDCGRWIPRKVYAPESTGTVGDYNHIAGDGREYVVTDATAMKIRAEDGRSVKKTDISMFINDLPNKKETRGFYTRRRCQWKYIPGSECDREHGGRGKTAADR